MSGRAAVSGSTTWRRAKRPLTPAAGPYGRPFHPAVVPVPLGAWLGSLVLDVGSRSGGPPDALATGSDWLLGLGLAGAAPSVVLGFLDLVQVPAGTRTMRLGLVHMALNVSATTLFLGDFLVRRRRVRDGDGVPTPLIGLSAAAFALLAVSGHLGGRLAYRYGVRVVDESAQLEGYGAAGAPS
jgi:uncharacterized membrane protein